MASISFLLACLLQVVLTMELIEVTRSLEKDGLHRVMASVVTVQIESAEELANCSYVFREKISKDTYVYLEELLKLTGFELHPL